MAETVEFERDGQIAKLSLNRPDVYNVLDFDLVESLANHIMALSVDNNVRGIVISGRGKAFCAGGDLKWLLSFPQGPSAGAHELAARFHQAILEIRRMSKPVIAAINGMAFGGGLSLALACDFRVMARSAILREAYSSRGLCIDGGGTFTLPRLVGLARALEIIAFDRPISSKQALAWGLTTKVVEDKHALEEAINMARELAMGSLSSFGWAKQLLTDSFNTAFEVQLERERAGICSTAAHPDGQEGMRAFVEKREPVFNTG
ncbi:MAG: enoyl-CoA hydratase/isomerase family protein [Desulfobacterales bacterium]|nr:enoyl-CoA hydratase/isomerase family protein [Desulfobacterales bacterium]